MEINHVEVTETHELSEALTSQAAEWKRAISEKIESLENRRTWEIADLLLDKRCLG